MQLYQKSYSRDTWPAISFTGDESSALHLVTNAVNVYDPVDFASGVHLQSMHLQSAQELRTAAYCSARPIVLFSRRSHCRC